MKENRKLERGFMVWIDIRDEIRDDIRDEVREEVKDEVRKEVKDEVREQSLLESKRETVLDLLCELGEIPENLEAIILSEARMDVLKIMVKIAAKATTFSEFEEKFSKL